MISTRIRNLPLSTRTKKIIIAKLRRNGMYGYSLGELCSFLEKNNTFDEVKMYVIIRALDALAIQLSRQYDTHPNKGGMLKYFPMDNSDKWQIVNRDSKKITEFLEYKITEEGKFFLPTENLRHTNGDLWSPREKVEVFHTLADYSLLDQLEREKYEEAYDNILLIKAPKIK